MTTLAIANSPEYGMLGSHPDGDYTPGSAPNAPGSLIATAVSSSRIDLTWSDLSNNETGFEVERSLDGVSEWTLLTTTSSNATAHASEGLSPSTTYYFRVRAINAIGSSAYTFVVSAQTTAPSTTQRAIWPIPAYKGYDHITTTSITMNAIDVMTATGEAPFNLFASAKNVTCTGTRNYGFGPIYPYMHLQHKWTLSKLGGGSVPHGDAIKSPFTDEPINPYVDRYSGEFTAVIHEPGPYVLELESSSPQHTASTTINITVTEPTYGHLWYDGLNGNDANDGNDPWGFNCVNASYTESTGELTEIGKFASYDHTAATSGQLPVDNYNWIYLGTTHGWRRITSKVSDDTIVIEPKLGSDQTGITSSSGPKQTFEGQSKGVNNHYMIHLRGNNGATTYIFDSSTFDFRTDTVANNVRRSIVGYDTDDDGVDILPGLGVTPGFHQNILSVRTNNDGYLAELMSAHNLDINGNGQEDVQVLGGNMTDDADTTPGLVLMDRVKGRSGAGGRAVQISSAIVKVVSYNLWGCSFDNHKWASESTGQCIYTASRFGARNAMIGTRLTGEADQRTFDHYIYPSGSNDHVDFAFNLFTGGINYGYCINLNASAERNYVSICDNFGDGDVDWFTDGSNISNNQTDGHFMNFVLARNGFGGAKALFFGYSTRRFTALDNVQFVTVGPRAMFNNAGTSHTNQDQVISRNRSYGHGLHQHRQSEHIESSDNIAYDSRTDTNMVEYSGAGITAGSVYDNNNFYAPNDSDGDIVRDYDDDARYTLAEFNSQSGYTNISNDPDWADPANGDFT